MIKDNDLKQMGENATKVAIPQVEDRIYEEIRKVIDVKKCQHGYYKVTYDNGKALCVLTKYSNIYYAPWGAEIVK